MRSEPRSLDPADGAVAEMEWVGAKGQKPLRDKGSRAAAAYPRFDDALASLLAGGLDYRTTLANVARIAIEFIAEGCFMDVLSEDGSMLRLSVLPRKPASATNGLGARIGAAGAKGGSDLVYHFSSSSRFPPAVLEVLASGLPGIVADFSEAKMRSLFGESLLPLPAGSVHSAMVVPLQARGRTLGAITFLSLSAGKSYDPRHFSVVERLTRFSGLALDNARRHALALMQRDRAHESSLAKEEFLAMLGHELKNFVIPILGWARSILPQADLLGGELQDGVHAIEANSEALARLVEDCIDISRGQGQMRLDREVVDMNQITWQSADAVRKTAQAKGLRIELSLAPTPLWVAGDRTRLTQVLMNLLTNAVNYTGPGGTIQMRSHRKDGRVETEIRDTGRGLTPDLIERIFDPFPRGGQPPVGPGLGLGLALTKRIIERHGGEIFAESPGPGCGSTFRFRLPAVEPAHAIPPQDRRAPEVFRPRRVLLIEDSRDILSLMKIEMEKLGYQVLTAIDGKAGLMTALRERPDVIVSDIKLPGIDGLELIRRMRQIPQLSSTPAIALTGLGMKRDAEVALACGYHAHLPKPVDARELSAMIQSLETPSKTS
jgi:signal transduction histidine kinase/ActR/RegA family two-component response regulator